MKECPQDPRWHSEGDVWTHTMLALDRLHDLDEWQQLGDKSRLVLEYAVVFHDVGKPLCSITDACGHISSRGHSLKGELFTRSFLLKGDLDAHFREQVCSLVRFHSRPLNCQKYNDPERNAVQCSWLVNNQLLYILAVADAKGRDGKGEDEALDWVREWKRICTEMNCFDRPFPFKSDHARVLFYRNKLPDLTYCPYENLESRVVMLSGLPGSGKSTWAAGNPDGLPVVSLDRIRRQMSIPPQKNQGKVIQEATRQCREFLRQSTDFVFDGTNVTRSTRRRWLNLFSDYRAEMHIFYFEPEFSTILSRNRSRQDESVPEKVLHKLAEKLQPPQLDECHKLEFLV